MFREDNMKKRFMTIMLTLAFGIVLGGGNSEAYSYPTNLNGDSNYILTYGHMSYGSYIDRRSVKVIKQTEEGILFSVNTVSGLVLAKDFSWIVPAQNVRRGQMQFLRIYDDSWNVIYTYNSSTQKWVQADLSNTYGYNQNLLGVFGESWKILTGSSYPYLKRN